VNGGRVITPSAIDQCHADDVAPTRSREPVLAL